jgi:osmotically-inducible protein OsmY
MKYIVLSLICGLASACGNMGTGTTGNSTTETTTPATYTPVANATNTEVNTRDRSDATMTPFDQNENSKDIAITAEIRKRLVSSTMSVNAANSKIMTQDGKVTLRGPVANAEEKARIDAIAKEVAGADKVDNQLEVAGN